MKTAPLPVLALTESDLLPFRVWRFVQESRSRDETFVREVAKLPVRSLTGCLIGTTATLANGDVRTILLSNIDLIAPEQMEHFLSVSIFRSSTERFDLARYHDFDAEVRGPEALADFLGLQRTQVFPMRYSLPRNLVMGHDAYGGLIREKPAILLSRAELIALAVP